jgi:hypothetical protein
MRTAGLLRGSLERYARFSPPRLTVFVSDGKRWQLTTHIAGFTARLPNRAASWVSEMVEAVRRAGPARRDGEAAMRDGPTVHVMALMTVCDQPALSSPELDGKSASSSILRMDVIKISRPMAKSLRHSPHRQDARIH